MTSYNKFLDQPLDKFIEHQNTSWLARSMTNTTQHATTAATKKNYVDAPLSDYIRDHEKTMFRNMSLGSSYQVTNGYQRYQESRSGRLLLQISNLPKLATADDLRLIFANFDVKTIIIFCNENGEPLGFANVHLQVNDSERFQRQLTGIRLHGQVLAIKCIEKKPNVFKAVCSRHAHHKVWKENANGDFSIKKKKYTEILARRLGRLKL